MRDSPGTNRCCALRAPLRRRQRAWVARKGRTAGGAVALVLWQLDLEFQLVHLVLDVSDLIVVLDEEVAHVWVARYELIMTHGEQQKEQRRRTIPGRKQSEKGRRVTRRANAN